VDEVNVSSASLKPQNPELFSDREPLNVSSVRKALVPEFAVGLRPYTTFRAAPSPASRSPARPPLPRHPPHALPSVDGGGHHALQGLRRRLPLRRRYVPQGMSVTWGLILLYGDGAQGVPVGLHDLGPTTPGPNGSSDK
jgi:hypothetical protein